MQLTVLQCGKCEPLKAGIHATALGLFVVMGVYNVAAWVARRDRHLALNAVVYGALTMWEQHHVVHHLAAIKRCHDLPGVAVRDEVPVLTNLAA